MEKLLLNFLYCFKVKVMFLFFMGLIYEFDGNEGAGKTTQIHLISKYLDNCGLSYRSVFEPGGSVIGGDVRRLLLDPDLLLADRTELHLLLADRAQLYSELKEFHANGGIVLKDRGGAASIAYQGFGRYNGDQKEIRWILDEHNRCVDGLFSERCWILLADVDVGLVRTRGRDGAADRFERLDRAFHERVYTGFKYVHENSLVPNTRFLDTTNLSPTEVFEGYLRPDLDSFLINLQK